MVYSDPQQHECKVFTWPVVFLEWSLMFYGNACYIGNLLYFNYKNKI